MSDQVIRWIETHPTLAIGAGVLAVAWLVLVFFVLRAGLRGLLSVGKRIKQTPAEDVLTRIAAVIAMGVAAHGMWNFFSEELPNLNIFVKIAFFGFLEIAVLACAVREKRARSKGKGGVDGMAVWVITGLSAFLAMLEADSFGLAVLRIIAPLVTAWLWERGMQIERERATGRKRLAWRITPEKLLARFGLVDPTDRDATEVAIQRYVTRVALAAKRLRAAPEGEKGWWKDRKRRRAARRLDRAMDKAVEYAGLADSPERRGSLLDQISALYNTRELAYVELPSPWTVEVVTVAPADVQESEVVTSSPVDVSTPGRPEIKTPGRLEIEAPAPVDIADDAGKILAYLTAPGAPTAGHDDPDSDPDDHGPGHGAPTGDPSWVTVPRPSAPSDPNPMGHDPGHDPSPMVAPARPAPVPVSFVAPEVSDFGSLGHDDPSDMGHALGHDPIVREHLAGLPSDAARVRVALTELGLHAAEWQVRDWLESYGVTITQSAAQTAIKRTRAAVQAGAGASVVSIADRRG